jgi:hypothetical protein
MIRRHFKAADSDDIALSCARSELFRDALLEVDSLVKLRELDWLQLKTTFCLIRAAYDQSDTNSMVLNLSKLNTFTRRYRLHWVPGLLEGNIPSILLKLSVAGHHKIRELSLHILSNLTEFIPDFLSWFDPDDIVCAVHDNLLCPFFPGQDVVFLWLGSILKCCPGLFAPLSNGIPLADISYSAIELVVQGETKFVTYFFCHFARFAQNSPEVFELCHDFFYFFFRKADPSPDIFVLLGTHSLLAAVTIPAPTRLDLIETMQLPQFLRTVLGAEMTEATFVAAALLTDAYELGFPVDDDIGEMLGIVHAVSLADDSKLAKWHTYLYDALARVLAVCSEDVLVQLWSANEGAVLGDLGAVWMNGSFAQKELVAECLFMFVNELPVEKVVREEVVEAMLEIVETDEKWMNKFIEAVKRMVGVPKFLEVFQAVDGPRKVADWEMESAALNDILWEMFGGDNALEY